MIALWLFLKAINPRTWLILALLAVLGYGGWRLYRMGVDHAAAMARNDVLQADKEEAHKERDEYAAAMDQAQKTEQTAVAAIKAANTHVAILDSKIAVDRMQQTTSVAAVSKLADPQLFADITARLGKRTALQTDTTFLPVEMREIDVRLAELPPVQDQVNDLGGKVDALIARSLAQDQKIASVEAQRTAILTYAGQLHDHYEKAYKLATPRVSLFLRIVTLGMKKSKSLDLPAPDAIPVPAQ